MKIVEKYTGSKTYMFPNGALATPDVMLEKYPALKVFTHIIETDEAGEVCFAIQNLSAMRGMYGIDASLTEDEAIVEIQTIINTEPEVVEEEPTAEERIAAALEYQVMASLPDEEETTTEEV